MSDRVDNAVAQLERAMEERVVGRLAERYGFVGTDALKWLRHERPTPSIPLPFCGLVEEAWCKGVRLNHGLHTQCTQPAGTGGLCKTCSTQAKKNKSGEPTYGMIWARQTHIQDGGEYGSWRDPAGKLVVPYSKVMAKLGISRVEAENEARRVGWTIPEEHFAAVARTAGRPRNSTAVSDTDSEPGDVPVKRRGRPRKQKVVVAADQGDDLIAHLLTQAPEAARPMKRKGRRPVRIVAPAQPARACGELEDDSSAGPALAPVTQDPVTQDPVLQDPVLQDPDGVGAASDEEVVAVKRFHWSGVTYLRGPDNVLYDPESQDEVGLWSPTQERVLEIPGQAGFD